MKTLKFGLANEGDSNRGLPKIFAGKNVVRNDTQKSFMSWFNQKKAWHMCQR